MNCRRSLSSEHGTLVATFDCINCGAEGDLRSPTCYGNVLGAFIEEVQIDLVTLADLNHRQYSGGLIGLLRSQAELLRGVERAALRPGLAAAEKSSACGACPMRPQTVFMPLHDALKRAPVSGVEDVLRAGDAAATAEVPDDHDACGECVTATVETARHLQERARESRALLGQVAYSMAEVSE